MEFFSKLCQALQEKNKQAIVYYAPRVFRSIDRNGNGTLDQLEILNFARLISLEPDQTAW